MPNRLIFAVTCIAGLMSAPMAAQVAGAQRQFVGTWEGKFKGRVFWTIKLQMDDKISGTLSAGHISVNDDGDLTEAEPSTSDEKDPILKANVEGNKLFFETDDGDEVMKFEMKIISEGQAELRFINTPVRIRPIHFERK